MYYEIIYLTNARNVYQMIDSLYFQIEEKAVKSQNSGEINYLDYLNILAKKQKTETDISTAENNLNIAYERLFALMNTNEDFVIVSEKISQINLDIGSIENNIEYQIFAKQSDFFASLINVNRQHYAPDFNLGYFYGSNNYPNSKTYNGFTIGIDIPLFWSEQKANTNAAKISYQINQNQFEDNLYKLNSKQKQLILELENYKELIRKYEETGSNLSEQIIFSAQKSYEAGEIDYFQFVNSMDNALNSLLYHYENISKYNKIILELKYLTI